MVQVFGPVELPKNIGWFMLLGMKESILFKHGIIINCVAYEYMIAISIYLGKDGDDIVTGDLIVLDTQNVIRKTNTVSDEFEEVDLSEFSSIDEQIEFLKRRDRIDIMYIT